MKSDGLSAFTDLHLINLGLLIFFVFFICVVLWALRKSGRELYAQIEQLPLKDDTYE